MVGGPRTSAGPLPLRDKLKKLLRPHESKVYRTLFVEAGDKIRLCTCDAKRNMKETKRFIGMNALYK